MILSLKDKIFLGVIAFLLVIILFFRKENITTNNIPKLIEDKIKIDSLSYLIKKQQDSIFKFKNEIDTLNLYNYKLKDGYNKNILTLKKIRDEYKKKDTIISFYNTNELERFFTDRYK